jgi:hypothetical protein
MKQNWRHQILGPVLGPVLGQGLLALLTSLLFAGSFVAGKYTIYEMGPVLITLLRYAIAAL